jgi:CBS-domain-containing membrane protein
MLPLVLTVSMQLSTKPLGIGPNMMSISWSLIFTPILLFLLISIELSLLSSQKTESYYPSRFQTYRAL